MYVDMQLGWCNRTPVVVGVLFIHINNWVFVYGFL